jgi:hypothetical protein
LSALIAYPASRPSDTLLQTLGEQPASPVNSQAFPQFADAAEAQT